jgi:hypothetical protein
MSVAIVRGVQCFCNQITAVERRLATNNLFAKATVYNHPNIQLVYNFSFLIVALLYCIQRHNHIRIFQSPTAVNTK